MNTLTIVLIVSLLIIGFVYVKTYKSEISKDKKIAVYIVTLVMPILGIILYFVFKGNKKHITA